MKIDQAAHIEHALLSPLVELGIPWGGELTKQTLLERYSEIKELSKTIPCIGVKKWDIFLRSQGLIEVPSVKEIK